MLLGVEKQGRLGVVELVCDLRRRQPPRDGVQDRAGLRTGEHQRDVLARVAVERRDARTVEKAARELVGTRIELRVRPPAVALDDRNAIRRDARALADDLGDRLAHRRNSRRILTNASGCSQKNRWPAPSIRSSSAPGIRSASTSELRGSTTLSSVPVTRSVGAVIAASTPWNPRPAAACACPPAGAGGVAARRSNSSCTSSGGASEASAFSTKRRSATSGASVAASANRSTVTCGIGTVAAPPTVVQQSTSLSTRSGAATASSCAIMPPRLAPSTCARSTPASSSTCSASSAIVRAVYGPSGLSDSPIPRLSKNRTR